MKKTTKHQSQQQSIHSYSKPYQSQQYQRNILSKKIGSLIGISLLALGLSACGGGSDDNSNHNNNNTPNKPADPTASFSKTAIWTVDGTKVGDTCYDFDNQAELDCSGETWDVKFTNKDRSVSLWSNSGISGEGHGASFYTMPWSELASLKNAQEVPAVGFKADGSKGVFSTYPWYEYDLNGQHKIAPNNRVYLVSTNASEATTTSTVNSPVYAVQLINYYDDAGVSGHPTIRWIDTALPTQVQTKTLDASSSDDWVYLNLATGDITDKGGDWQVGFKRYDVMLNGGASGDKNVGGYVAKTPAGYYDAKGEVIKDKFKQDNRATSLADLIQVATYDVSDDGVPWILDESGSQLNPKSTGTYPVIDYGWYVYKGNEGHRLFAKEADERIGGLVRSGEGDSYARFYLDEIKYADDTATTPSAWVFKFEVQPK